MTMPLPPAWASNTNYSAGPDAGSVTKVDPASQANGFVRGVNAAAQHVNFVLDPLTRSARRAFLLAALQQRQATEDAVTITDTAESMGAVQRAEHVPLIALKTAQAFALSGSDRFSAVGVPASITSLVTDAATDGARIVVIGTGGNRCAFSDDDGVTWTAGGTLANTPGQIVWNATYGKFIVTVNSAIKHSTNAVAWTLAASAADTAGGLAILSNGDTFYIDSVPHVSKSSDGGATWSGSFTLPNAGSFDESGRLAGNAGAFVYHVARLSSGASLQVSASADGATWTAIATFTAPPAQTFASLPRIMMCQNTGLLVIVAPLTGGFVTSDALYASLDGVDWAGPHYNMPTRGINAYGVAGGRVLSTFNAALFASDGIGF